MLSFRKFVKNEKGIGFILGGAILLFGALFVGGIILYFFIQMMVQNIIPIAIAIVLVIVLPIAIKGWYYKKTGTEYGTKAGG